MTCVAAILICLYLIIRNPEDFSLVLSRFFILFFDECGERVLIARKRVETTTKN